MKKNTGSLLDRTRIVIKIRDGKKIFEVGELLYLIENFLGKYSYKLEKENLRELRMWVRVMNYTGRQSEYEIKTDVFCDNGVFSSKKVSWNLHEGARRTLVAIAEQMLRK